MAKSSTKIAELKQELEQLEVELTVIDDELNALKARKRSAAERKEQIEQRLRYSAEQSSSNAQAWQSTSLTWSAEVQAALQNTFGCTSFRAGQLSAINATMSNEDVLLTMPTGGGKSLTYQLPAVVQGGVTLVISPLVSLMQDQVYQLKRRNIDAAFFAQSTSKEEMQRINDALVSKTGTLRLLYATPEKLAKSKRLMSKLEKCHALGLLRRIAVDEVHCCSVWGHDFRPDYKFLNVLRRQFPKVPILGLTATASEHVMNDVKQMLAIPSALVFRTPFNRPNLSYSVLQKPSSAQDTNKLILQQLTDNFAGQTGIIYVFSRKEAQELSDFLRMAGVKALFYHADLTPESRTLVHESWLTGKTRVIVATVAFGMGIDKPDVRFVIHHSLPKSGENYYQESGRAGRDGEPAACILLYRLADVFRQSTMVCTEQTGQAKLYDMLKYCVNECVCRRAVLAEQFGEDWSPDWCVQQCDVCAGRMPQQQQQVVNPNALLAACKQMHGIIRAQKDRITAAKLVELWIKSQPKGDRPSLTQAERTLAELLLDGYLREEFHFTPYSIISYIQPGRPPLGGACSMALGSPPKKKAKTDRTEHVILD